MTGLKHPRLLVVLALVTVTSVIPSAPAEGRSGALEHGGLFSIVALAPDDVWAFGATGGPSLRSAIPLILHWDGTAWTSVPPPVAAGAIQAASASGADDVWILGEAERAGRCHSFIREFDGTRWQRIPGRHRCGWEDVLALAPDDTWLADGQKLAHWDGSSWDETWTVPCRTRECRHGWLVDLDAASATDAWGVGWPAISAHLGLHGWHRVGIEVPRKPPRWHSQIANLSGVETVGAHEDWAVGEVDRLGSEYWIESDRFLAERWNGDEWRIVRTPDVQGPVERLNAVAAAGGVTWAVGNSYGSTGWANAGVVMRRQRDGWQILPLPSRARDLYDAVAISSVDAWTVGDWKSASGGRVPLILHWDGTAWSRFPIP